ncbi:YuzF family protein [Bacillus sp. JCM 19041]|uniref:YuzF family protein n=1 Tax=Bacillus sp. JCM 19041 TaxID=1460637 RepID=UPI0006CF572D
MNNQTEWHLSDPYVYGLLKEQIGIKIGLQTTRGSIVGKLTAVHPDHIVVEMGGTPFYIRTEQIIWFYPAK